MADKCICCSEQAEQWYSRISRICTKPDCIGFFWDHVREGKFAVEQAEKESNAYIYEGEG